MLVFAVPVILATTTAPGCNVGGRDVEFAFAFAFETAPLAGPEGAVSALPSELAFASASRFSRASFARVRAMISGGDSLRGLVLVSACFGVSDSDMAGVPETMLGSSGEGAEEGGVAAATAADSRTGKVDNVASMSRVRVLIASAGGWFNEAPRIASSVNRC